MPSCVQGEADEVVEFGRPWLQFETALIGIEGTIVLMVVAEPGSEFCVSVSVGLDAKFALKFRGAGAAQDARGYGQDGRKN